MNSVEKEYYKANINYAKWEKEILLGYIPLTAKGVLQKKEHFDDVNKKTINKNFIYIAAFFEWMKEVNTVKYYKETINNGKFEPHATGLYANRSSFETINLFPYSDDNKSDIIPIIDVTSYIEMVSVEKNTKAIEKLKEVYAGLPKKLKDYSDRSRIGLYIDKNHQNMDSANDGLYFQLLSSINKNPNDFIVSAKGNKRLFGGIRQKLDGIMEKYFDLEEEFLIANSNESDLENVFDRINDLGRSIKAIIQSILSMIENLHNSLSSDGDDPIKIDDLGNTISSSNADSVADIESIMMKAKPGIRPLFKKSYIVRENNLKPYITIIMAYFSVANREPVIIKNFDVPYNNILNFEHNVKDHTINISLIDTEGALSELLIQKMYSVSQNKANVKKSNVDGDASMPYNFLIEYGWSGPETDDEDELLEEGVFTKTVHTGYITSISSQFTPKGNEYSLTIKPNDHESVAKYLNNFDIMYLSSETELSTVTGVIALFLILWSGSLYTTSPGGVKSFQELFVKIENAKIYRNPNLNYWIDTAAWEKGNNGQISNGRHSGYVLTHKDSFPLSTEEGKEIENVLTKLFGDKLEVSVSTDKEEPLKNITFNKTLRLDNLKKACDAGDFVMNGWIAAIYLLWKMKRYFKEKNEDFIIADTTGLFDVFNDKDEIKDEKIFRVINIFNPLASSQPETLTDFEKVIKFLSGDMRSKKSKNMFEVKNLLDFKELNGATGKSTKLTLFTNQISTVFKSIQDVGLNCKFDGNNSNSVICQTSSAIDSDLAKYDLQYNKLVDIQKEYKIRLYTDKFNLIPIENLKETKLADKYLNIFFENLSSSIRDAEQRLESAKKEKKEAEKNRGNPDFVQYTSTDTHLDNNIKLETDKLEKAKKDFESKKINILYLTYIIDANKISYLNVPVKKKISLFSRNVAQSYSFMPRIKPKTRSPNRQFFTQGNKQILREGTGDIIEFSMDPIDIGNFSSLMISNKNKNNIIFENLSSNTNLGGIYDNAAKYYTQYKDIDGNVNPHTIARDLAKMDLNYQTQMNLKGSITIIGEPYWSGINSLMKYIFVNVYYTNGQRSSFTGLYYVTNIVQNISEGKFTTKLEIVRAPTFLSNLEQIGKKNVVLS